MTTGITQSKMLFSWALWRLSAPHGMEVQLKCSVFESLLALKCFCDLNEKVISGWPFF